MPSVTESDKVDQETKSNITRVAALVSIATVLQISESLIPHPVPGVRLGLANMITLVALVEMGFGAAMEISILRCVLSSFVLGTFLTPTFILSVSGALLSTIFMWVFYRLSSRLSKYGFSLIGISIIGAVIHNISQLALAYYLLIKHPSIFYFLPLLMISSIVMGLLTGLVAAQVLWQLKYAVGSIGKNNIPVPDTDKLVDFSSQSGARISFLHRLAPQWKIFITIIFSVLVLFLTNWWGYLALGVTLGGLMLLTKVPGTAYISTLSRFRRLSSFIIISFTFPVLFSYGNNVLVSLGPLKITEQGLATGGLFALRIIFLIWLTFLLNLFTTPEEMTTGIGKLLAPFRVFGLRSHRIAAVLSLSWNTLPSVWNRTRAAIRNNKTVDNTENRPGILTKIRRINLSLSNLITSLYRQGEEISDVK
ncbi:MAG: Gx transporter family protein [Planctomycetota bacterium]